MPVGSLLARLGRRRYAMLLEDMAPARVGDQVEGGSGNDAEAMLLLLGRMHGCFWNSPEVEARHWIHRIDTAPRPILLMYKLALPEFQNRYGDRVREDFRALQGWLLDHGIELLKSFMEAPFTLNHGDFRLDNVFFTGESGNARDSGVVLFDWQVPCQAPGAYDLAYFLSSTLDPGISREDEDALLRFYHDQLLAEGVSGYRIESLRRDYERALLLLVQRIVTALPGIDVTNERGRVLFELWVDRLAARVEGLDPERLLHGDP
jgi:aminoglycoside/choline kinase family phosphotransferase